MILNTHTIFPDGIIADACNHAKDTFPNESCGVIYEDGYIPFENKSDNVSNSFLINDPLFDNLYIEDKVKCIIHSHNDHGHASKGDQIQQQELDLPFGIINLKNKSITQIAFWGESIPTEPLMKRTFFFGVWDCFALVRDFLIQKYNIIPPDPPREYGFWLRNESVFEDWIQEGKTPFRKISNFKNVLPGDVLFYNLFGNKYINHCGVVSDDNLVLHHFEHRVSTKTPISFCQESLRYIYRLDKSLLGNEYEGWEL